jgi:hypothetical protein
MPLSLAKLYRDDFQQAWPKGIDGRVRFERNLLSVSVRTGMWATHCSFDASHRAKTCRRFELCDQTTFFDYNLLKAMVHEKS